MTTTLKPTAQMAPDTLLALASRLADKLSAWGQPAKSGLLVRALHELLDGQDKSTKELRAAVQIHLALASNGTLGSSTLAAAKSDEMLSTQEAAQLMACSRPYVAMLIDADRLPGGVKSTGGHRKVPRASVLQWIEATRLAQQAPAGDNNYRSAAKDAGMYSIPDDEYLKVAHRSRQGAN